MEAEKSAFAEALAMELENGVLYCDDVSFSKNLSKKLQDIGQCGQKSSLRQLNVIQT